MLKKVIFLIIIGSYTLTFCQTNVSVEAILKKAEKYYAAENEYSYITAYKFFESEKSNISIENKQGAILRLNNVNYQKMDFTETFNFGNQAMVIDNKSKTVYITKNVPKESVFSFASYLKNFPKKKIILHPDYWICEMAISKNALSQYYKIRFYIDKKDFSLYKQVFYISGNQEIESKGKKINLVNPRLEIILRKKTPNSLEDRMRIKKDNYFTLNKGKIVVSNKYKNYKVISN